MPSFEAVIFDMDGVLCHLDDDARIAHLVARTGQTSEFVHDAIWGSGFEDRSDKGEFSADEYLDLFGGCLGRSFTRAEWVAYRRSGMTPISEALAIASDVARLVPCALLTNNGHLLAEEIDGLFSELRAIFGDRIWASARFGRQKPDPEIFLQACALLGSRPAETLFIDDRADNVAGAIEAGLQGHVFRGVDGLRACIYGEAV